MSVWYDDGKENDYVKRYTQRIVPRAFEDTL